jgi:vacuolar-type H+-ATPase subunit I/STV1
MGVSSEKKISITKRILEVKDASILDKIEQLLEEAETVAYTSDGTPLTRKEYIERIENISSDVEARETTYSSEEAEEYIVNRRQ